MAHVIARTVLVGLDVTNVPRASFKQPDASAAVGCARACLTAPLVTMCVIRRPELVTVYLHIDMTHAKAVILITTAKEVPVIPVIAIWKGLSVQSVM